MKNYIIKVTQTREVVVRARTAEEAKVHGLAKLKTQAK